MKKLLPVLLLSSLVYAKECIVEVDKLKVREEPSLNSKVIAILEAGTVVKITGENKDWYEVGIGFLKKDYCTILDKKNDNISTANTKPKNVYEKGYLPQIVDKIYSYVAISLTDVSRITCPREIKWFTYSKEKQIQIQKAGNNLLVKISPKVITINGQVKEVKRETFPRELIVECGGQIFTLILIPKKIPTQTIVLKPIFEDKKKALKFETATPYEETIKNLIKKVYKEEQIDGYEILEVNKIYKRFKRVVMKKRRIYKGAYYKVTEYILIAKTNIDLHEKLFLPYLPDSTVAISLTKLHLNAGETARLFVIEKEES